MSEWEHIKGTIKKLEPLAGETIQQTAKRELDRLGEDVEDYWNGNYVECLESYWSRVYAEIDGVIYQVTGESEPETDDIFRMSKNENGTLDFEVRYYNGGCGFNEALVRAFKKMDGKPKQ